MENIFELVWMFDFKVLIYLGFSIGFVTLLLIMLTNLKYLNPKVYPLVSKYIGELRAEVQEKYAINFEKHITELAKIRNEALKKGAWSAAVNAEVARGKAGGLYVDQKLIMTGNVDAMSADEIKEKLRKILDDNKELINITPDEVELDNIELPKQ